MFTRKKLAIACCLAFATANFAYADDTSDLKAQIETLQKQMDALKAKMEKMEQTNAQMQKQVQVAGTPMIKEKPGSPLTFSVGSGEVTLYGHADVSADRVDNGLAGRAGAVGSNGPLSQVSSNLSYFGVRGSRPIADNLTGVFQFETEVAYSSTPGPTTDAQVKTALGSRNSFVGIKGSWGAVKLGKTDAPYKLSTARMDPFASSVGDYNSIIGNSGGDNRAEFDTRLSHAAWYESPKFNGFRVGFLVSPGQNRASDNSIQARGEPNCTGGNQPPCGDGSFGTAWSGAGSYSVGPLYAILGYELHKDVNRSNDELGTAGGTIPPAGAVGIADERAWKVGVQYNFTQSGTTLNAIYENLNRSAPVDAFNERTRHSATWLALTQKVTPKDDLNVGWAHAGKTPGDPGAALQPGNGLTPVAGPNDNAANMYALGYKHHFDDKKTTWYLVYAEQRNHPGAHYDLGASGHGVTVDCHDAAGNCFSGATLKAVSVGLTYNF